MTAKSIPPAIRTARGRPLPLGISSAHDGVNFALLCRHGPPSGSSSSRWTATTAARRDPPRSAQQPHRRSLAHPRRRPAAQGFRYGWRVDGPTAPGIASTRPSSCSTPPRRCSRRGASGAIAASDDRQRTSRRSLFFARPRYDWREDAPPLVTRSRTRSSTSCTSAASPATRRPAVAKPGTFAGLIEKIPYLKWLGVTAVELLPIHEFDEDDCPFTNPITGERLRNFWGYNSIAFAAPKAAYAASASRPRPGATSSARWSRAFHAAGIEVILDVVFNHTGEGDDRGRTYSFRGLDNTLYYMLDPRRPIPELLRLRQHGQLQPSRRPRPDAAPACATGSARCTSTACASTWPRSWAAIATATCWSSRPSSR